MDRHIPEADWRQFKQFFPVWEERFCQRVLDDLAGLLRAGGGTAHDQLRLATAPPGERWRN